MEYLPGGDLYSVLQHQGALTEDDTRTYAFQIVHALAYLHSLGIIHRDIKPDNILITAEGRLKLTDFGLSHRGLIDRQAAAIGDDDVAEARSFVGTPDYVAPEIFMRRLHMFAADWWSLGILIYECLVGMSPFDSDAENEIHQNVLKGVWEIPEDFEISPQALDLLQGLLQCDPTQRLGAGGSQQIINHPWFAGLSLDTLVPPFVPELKDPRDTGYFECRYAFSEAEDADIQDDIIKAQAKLVGILK